MPAVDQGRLHEVVVDALESFGAERRDIHPEATLDDLDVDSLDLVELAQIVEDEFDVRLAPEEFKGVSRVGDALDVAQRALDRG